METSPEPAANYRQSPDRGDLREKWQPQDINHMLDLLGAT